MFDGTGPNGAQQGDYLPLSQDSYENLVSGVGNHEAKLILLGVVALDLTGSYGCDEMAKILKELQGSSAVWAPAAVTIRDYCEQSLEPIGAVFKETRSMVNQVLTFYGYT